MEKIVRKLSSKTKKEKAANPDKVDGVLEMHNMRRLTALIDILQKGAYDNKVQMCERIDRDIHRPFKSGSHAERVKLCYYLAESGTIVHLTKFFDGLKVENADDRPLVLLVLKLFRDYADVSVKIREKIGQSGLLVRLLDDVQTFLPKCSGDKTYCAILRCAVCILHMCARLPENLHVYRDLDATDILWPCVTSNDLALSMCSLCVICNVTADKEDVRRIDVLDKIIHGLLGVLKATLRDKKLKANLHETRWSAHDIASVLGSLALNNKNRDLMLQGDVIPLLTSLMKQGNISDQLCSVNTLWTIFSPDKKTEKMKADGCLIETLETLYESEDHEVKLTAERVLKVLESQHVAEVEAPVEITGLGEKAERAYRRALRKGCVKVNRARIMVIGDDQVGKTSLKNSLLGIPFNPEQQSTVGIEVDPSLFQIDVDNVQNWKKLGEDSSRLGLMAGVANLVVERMKHEPMYPTRTPSEEIEIAAENRRGDVSKPSALSQSQKIDAIAEDSDDSSFAYDSDENSLHDEPTETDDVMSGLHELGDHIPRDVLDHVMKYIDGLELQNRSDETEAVLSVWDFAGQHLYYSLHLPFLTPKALYLLCYNLEKDLSALARPSVRQGAATYVLDENCKKTNLDSLHAWLISVHSVARASRSHNEAGPVCSNGDVTECVTTRDLKYRSPPVLLVGTHADRPYEDPGRMEEKLMRSLKGKEYKTHLTHPFFRVDNTKELPKVDDLRGRISELLKNEALIGQKVPVRWFQFERAIEEFTKRDVYFVKLDTVNRIAREVCFIKDETELESMLTFYHSLGLIVKHGGTVVLKTQWLISLFSKLITVRPFGEQDPELVEYWDRLEDTGILDTRLADHVLRQLKTERESREDLLAMMESYGLIAGFEQVESTPEGGQRKTKCYLVPAQLSLLPNEVQNEDKESELCCLYCAFPDGFLPNGIFPRFVCCCIKRCSVLGCVVEPNLFKNGARFLAVGPGGEYNLLLTAGKHFIKVSLVKMGSPSNTKGQVQNGSDFVYQVRLFIEKVLKESIQSCGSVFKAPYMECVACPSCAASNRKCTKHHIEACKDDDCLHLIPVSSVQHISCSRTFGKGSRPDIRGLDLWFPDRNYPKNRENSSLNEHAQVKEGCPSARELNELAAELSTTWRLVGRALDLDEPLLDAIKEENPKTHEQCYAMLNLWKQKNGQNATFHVLFSALKNKPSSRHDLAAKFCCDSQSDDRTLGL